jgi:hypothetical protein
MVGGGSLRNPPHSVREIRDARSDYRKDYHDHSSPDDRIEDEVPRRCGDRVWIGIRVDRGFRRKLFHIPDQFLPAVPNPFGFAFDFFQEFDLLILVHSGIARDTFAALDDVEPLPFKGSNLALNVFPGNSEGR